MPLAVGGNVRGDSAVRVMRDRLGPDEVVVRFGVPTTRAPRSLFDAMRTSDSLREAVVAMDIMAAAERVSVRRMADYLRSRPGWRGAPLAAEALRWASEDSRSPNETRMRLVWRLDAALPSPLVNRPVSTGEDDFSASSTCSTPPPDWWVSSTARTTGARAVTATTSLARTCCGGTGSRCSA